MAFNIYAQPKSANLSNILVQATRGDNFVMYVDNVEYFKETLKRQSGLKEAAMQYLDPEWSSVAEKVKKMTANVTGKALNKIQQKEDLNAEINKFSKLNIEGRFSRNETKLTQKTEITNKDDNISREKISKEVDFTR